MAAEPDRCRSASMAALEVVLDECEGRDGHIGELGENAFAFIPEGALPDHLLDTDPDDEATFENAVAECMETSYAHNLAEALLGDEMSRRNLKHARRSLCERLLL